MCDNMIFVTYILLHYFFNTFYSNYTASTFVFYKSTKVELKINLFFYSGVGRLLTSQGMYLWDSANERYNLRPLSKEMWPLKKNWKLTLDQGFTNCSTQMHTKVCCQNGAIWHDFILKKNILQSLCYLLKTLYHLIFLFLKWAINMFFKQIKSNPFLTC